MSLSASKIEEIVANYKSTTPHGDQGIKYLLEQIEASRQGAAVADLNQTIAGPTVGEVQAISDKVDALLAELRSAGVIAS